MDAVTLGLSCLGAYLLGAVPFGLLLVRAFRHEDIRAAGSGNIGATNVARVAGKALGVGTLVLDAAKGAAPVVAARFVNASLLEMSLLGAAAFLGHCFPVYLRFHGGKGIATGFGVILALNAWAALVAFAVFGTSFALTRISSLSSLAGVGSVGVLAVVAGAEPRVLGLLCAMIGVVILKHAPNIKRLWGGQEHKF